MSWLFSQALVEEYLPAICSDGKPCARLSGNPTQQAYLSQDKMTEFSRLSRFGMTYRPLMENLGEAVLMSYLEAFPARTSAQPEKAQELQENGQECGFIWPESWARYDPNTSLWRTRQCSLLGDLEPFSETWPRWGTMRDGEFWEQPTLALRTSETEFGLWRTPTVGMINADRAKDPEYTARKEAKGQTITLADQVKNQRLWPTPTVCGNYNRKGASATSGDGLATAVTKWPTPTAHMAKETNAPSESLRNEPSLSSRVGGTLNPMWVEWLMGWPLGWTDLKPLAMDKYPQWQQQHGGF